MSTKQYVDLSGLSVYNEEIQELIPNHIELTQSEYNNLSNAEKNDPTKYYYITDASVIGVETIGELGDVDITSPTSGQALVYDSTNNEWINGEVSSVSGLGDLTDVTITSPTNNQVLKYNSTTSKWENSTGGSGASTLAGLTDITITTLADGQGLVYDSTTGKWKNAYLSGAKYDSSNTLADIIGDVESLLAAL